MSLSAFFLMIFLLQHFAINFTSVFSSETFNDVSHFMGTNSLIQFVLQPVLLFGVVFHFIMGFVLEIQNTRARGGRYIKDNGSSKSTWMSRNMIWTGLVIFSFLILHFIDFWIPELNTKFVQNDWSGIAAGEEGLRYFTELKHKFVNPIRVGVYCLAFIFLALHLLHGFNSAFQSLGANNSYTKSLKNFGVAFAVLVPLGFVVIALFHHFNQ